MMANRSLEIKVGLFLLVSVAILVGFLFILGTFDFSQGHIVQLQFPNTGGLRDGAKVKISGVQAGRIQEIEFLGGKDLNSKGEPIYVRIEIEIDLAMAPVLTEGSRFFVSTEGILGEKYIEITPGPPGGPQIPSGTTVEAEPPVEMQVLAARAAGMMDEVQQFMAGDREQLKTLGDSMRQIVEHTNSIVTTLDTELPALVDESKATLAQARASMARIDELVADSRTLMSREDGLSEGVSRANRLAARLEEDLPQTVAEVEALLVETRELVAEARGTVSRLESDLAMTTGDARALLRQTGQTVRGLNLDRLVGEFREPVLRLLESLTGTGQRVSALSDSAHGLLGKADAVLVDVSSLTTAMRQGKGSLGALLKDKELYDDIRELILDLKRHPWKAVWKD
jgi:phospholipid/cholesterol/gamma-HCH transport system substrate-binding protein